MNVCNWEESPGKKTVKKTQNRLKICCNINALNGGDDDVIWRKMNTDN